LFDLPENCTSDHLRQKIRNSKAGKIVAVGGDGTVKLVAESLLEDPVPLGILPAGSANGMAKELGLPNNLQCCLDVIVNGVVQTIHAVKVNNELCIHLSDIGFNAFVVKKFHGLPKRGKLSYLKAAWKVLWNYDRMQVTIETDEKEIYRQAAMVVIANATTYGTGAVINPGGSLNDRLFEIVIVRKLSFKEILKMKMLHLPYDCSKTEVFQTRTVKIKTRHRAHFQVDGEYLGKVTTVQASLIPACLQVIMPA